MQRQMKWSPYARSNFCVVQWQSLGWKSGRDELPQPVAAEASEFN
jgi:hypothetical protein